jgi:Protein of unknown function (DUF1353)
MGTFFCWIIVLFGLLLLALLLYFLFGKKKVEIVVTSERMPNLRPLPIPMKGQDIFMRIAIWLFSMRRWVLLDNWYFTLEDGTEIVLHKGFEFDGASIPRPLWFFLSPTGLLLIPGLLHDYGYKYNQLWQKDSNGQIVAYKKDATREEWDELFWKVGQQINGLAVIDYIAYLGVKYFGKGAWEKHRKANDQPSQPV